MRVTVLTTSFPVTPGSVSGIFIERLVSNFPDEIEATVVTPCAHVPMTSLQDASFRVKCFRYAPFVFQRLAHRPGGIPVALRKHKLLWLLLPFLAAMLFACLRAARESDVIHANWSVNGVVAGLAGLLTRTPVLTTLRGEDVTRLHNSRISGLALRLCLSLSRRVVAVSDAIHRTVVQCFPDYAYKVVMIPNGVDDALFGIQSEARRNTTRLLAIGSLIPRKGFDQILVALSQLPEIPDLELTIIGDGPERGVLEPMIVSLGLSSRVRLLGSVAPNEVPAHLAQADIFLLASYSEGRPNVLLEAMAACLPVIASRIEGVDELIKDGENGLFFEPGRPDQLASQIATLAADWELRKRIARAARRFIVEKGLTWQATARSYTNLYQELISSMPGHD